MKRDDSEGFPRQEINFLDISKTFTILPENFMAKEHLLIEFMSVNWILVYFWMFVP